MTGHVLFTTPGYVTDLQIYICNEALAYMQGGGSACSGSGLVREGGSPLNVSSTDPQPLATCIGVFAWTPDRHSRPTWLSQTVWVTNGTIGWDGATGFRIDAEYFGLQLGLNTITATVTNPNSGQVLTQSMQATFDSGGQGCIDY